MKQRVGVCVGETSVRCVSVDMKDKRSGTQTGWLAGSWKTEERNVTNKI